MTSSESLKHPYCQNSSHRGNATAVIPPQCRRNRQEFEVTIRYSHAESDTLRLCSECTDRVEEDATGHGYEVEIVPLDEVYDFDLSDLREIANGELPDAGFMAVDVAMSLLANEPIDDVETRDSLYGKLADFLDTDNGGE